MQQKVKQGHKNTVLILKKIAIPHKSFCSLCEPLEILVFLHGWAEFNHSYTTPSSGRAIPGCCIDLLLKGG